MGFSRIRPPDFHLRVVGTSFVPARLEIGDFTIDVETITKQGEWDSRTQTGVGVSGTGWLRFACSSLPQLVVGELVPEGFLRVSSTLKVVSVVSNVQTEISLQDARYIRSDVVVGQNLDVKVDLPASEFQKMVQAGKGIGDYLVSTRGLARVAFNDVTVKIVDANSRIGRIVQGNAVYPADRELRRAIELSLGGFTALVGSVTLTPAKALASIVVRLPGSIGSAVSCEPAELPLGVTEITPDCQFYVEKPDGAFGPWIVGETGMIISGVGFVADFSSHFSPSPLDVSWRGVVLQSGRASGENFSPGVSNTGFVNARYDFSDAYVTGLGLEGNFLQSGDYAFETLNPRNYTVRFSDCALKVQESRIVGGNIGQGSISFPVGAICAQNAGVPSGCVFTNLTIQEDLDIVGEVDFKDHVNTWGELTHRGGEELVWCAVMGEGELFLPSWTATTYSPDTGTSFDSLFYSLLSNPSATLQSKKVTGATITLLNSIEVFSPDHPGGKQNPIKPGGGHVGWLRIGSMGLSGELILRDTGGRQDLGDKDRSGYVGKVPFDTLLYPVGKKELLLGQFIDSAVYDSDLSGRITLDASCNMSLDFAEMKLSSTANITGGDIQLPQNGVTLDYWRVQLVPTGDPAEAGVVSVRTGRLIFTAAGLSEPVHFDAPFNLTWGEILADGNIGELFFDYNNYGQRFDGFNLSPHHISLSEYLLGRTDGYLSVCGGINFNFFGAGYVNIKDARNDPEPNAPFKGRYVTTPKKGEAGCEDTNLHLHGEWNNQLAVLDFPDPQMGYNVAQQNGFTGSGLTDLDFVKSNSLDSKIVMHKDAIDIRLSSVDTHDLVFQLFSGLGGIGGLSGCIRIEGPTLTQISVNGYLERSAGEGIIGPKVGAVVETVMGVTPTSCAFLASGDMLLAVATASIDVGGYVSLLVDFEEHSAQGEFLGIIDCSSVVSGLSGSGQLTWFAGPSSQYLQGRIAMKMCNWVSETDAEGGLFIGANADKDKAWVLQNTGDSRFGVPGPMLPAKITGFYGYACYSESINLFLFGGGYELFAGLGVFDTLPNGATSAWDIPGLPYVIGSGGVYLHGEILGGLVSASAWAQLSMRGPVPLFFEGRCGLEGCVLWVICASVDLRIGFGSGGFYAERA